MSKKSSLQRTLNILNRLNDGKKITLLELSLEFDVSERTIRRDIELLQEEFDNFIIKDGKYYYTEKKELLKDILSGKDLSILLNIIHLFSLTKNKLDLPPELEKIYHENKKIYNFINKPFEEIKNKNIMYELEKIISNRRVCKIEYSNGIDNKVLTLTIKAYKILLLNENFYLFCETDGKFEQTLLRIGLIKEIKVLPNTFYPNPQLVNFSNNIQTPFSKFSKNGELKEVIVSVPKYIAKYFKMKKYLPSQRILSESESGWLTISYKVTRYEEITELIEKWLPKMKIQSPPELKDIIRKNLESKLKVLD